MSDAGVFDCETDGVVRPRVVALLTGRGGSAFAGKNVVPVCGRPLLCWAADAARRSARISDFYASSDDEAILAAAAASGYEPILRPKSLARADSRHEDVLVHALSELAKRDVRPDILIVLMANSVTVRTEWIDEAVRLLIADARVSAVCPVRMDQDHHPLRARRLDADGFLRAAVDPGTAEVSSNRQELYPCYFYCHNFWALNLKEALRSDRRGDPPWPFMGRRIVPMVVSDCFDVHDPCDLVRCERWLRENDPSFGHA